MKWTEITIKTTTEAVEAVTNILYEQNNKRMTILPYTYLKGC